MITGTINSPVIDTDRAYLKTERLLLVRITLIALLLQLCGCATITTPSGDVLLRGGPEFRDYAAEVFRRQNATLTSMFDAFEYADDAEAAELDRAEQRMIESCAALNSAASARRDGRNLDVSTLKRVADSIVVCDTATLEAEQLIRRVQTSALQN